MTPRLDQTIRLWTIQPEAVWLQLQAGQPFVADLGERQPPFEAAYAWMAHQMATRIGAAPPGSSLPVWAWAQWGGVQRRRPDLRTSGLCAPGTRAVRLEVVLPATTVLLSDFELWHYVLNRWYLPSSEADDAAFAACLERAGLDYPLDPATTPIQLWRRIEESWIRIFDLGWAAPYVSRPREAKMIQATFWMLQPEQIRQAQLFRAR